MENKVTGLQETDMPTLEKYAIFKTGGKQYTAFEGQTLGIEKLNAEAGDAVTFTDVLLRKSGDAVELGQPFLATPIQAVVVKHTKGPKVIAFKFKRRKKYRRKVGHRQPITVVRIQAI